MWPFGAPKDNSWEVFLVLKVFCFCFFNKHFLVEKNLDFINSHVHSYGFRSFISPAIREKITGRSEGGLATLISVKLRGATVRAHMTRIDLF